MVCFRQGECDDYLFINLYARESDRRVSFLRKWV